MRTTRRTSHLGACLALLLAVICLSGCDQNASISPPRAPADVADSEADAAQGSLALLVHAVGHDESRATAGVLAQVGARGGEIVQNAHTLGIRDLQLSYLDQMNEVSPESLRKYGAGAWAASVGVSYRLPVDVGTTSMEVAFVFVPQDDGPARIAAVGGHGDRSALWLDGPIDVRRDARLLLVTAHGQSVQHYWQLAKRAVRDVARVLPSWRRTLVVEVPGSQRQLEQLIDAPAGSYRLIAGVTASVDGTVNSRTPLHSFFNVDLFDQLGPKGAQVVASHEATLQATRAPVAPMPTWMKEGFADYVALAHADVSLRTASKEIRAKIRRSGAPTHLPTDGDFDPAGAHLAGLNAVYEGAWLACRYIATNWDEPALLAVYRELDHGRSFGAVLPRILGVDRAQFVSGWRRYLSGLATSLSTGPSKSSR